MDLISTAVSVGYASGLNAYGTALMLGLLGRAGIGEVPDELTKDPILIGSGVMYAIEFVTDKVPYLDNTWDLIHTAVRPAIGGALGIEFAGAEQVSGFEEALVGTGSGATALTSHAIKAGLRLGINVSPEPFSNILVSLTEDGLVALVVAFAVEEPLIALGIVIALFALGIWLVILIRRRIRLALERRRARRRGESAGSDAVDP